MPRPASAWTHAGPLRRSTTSLWTTAGSRTGSSQPRGKGPSSSPPPSTPPRAGIVLSMFDVRTKLSEDVEEQVRGHFSGRVFRSVIPRSVRLAEAPSFGQPAALHDPRSKGAQAYRDLALEILGQYETTPAGGTPAGRVPDATDPVLSEPHPGYHGETQGGQV